MIAATRLSRKLNRWPWKIFAPRAEARAGLSCGLGPLNVIGGKRQPGDFVLIRVADPEDAEAVSGVINAAFRKAEGFLIDRDRIDLQTVQELLKTGAFLVAEENKVVVGCVHIEM